MAGTLRGLATCGRALNSQPRSSSPEVARIEVEGCTEERQHKQIKDEVGPAADADLIRDGLREFGKGNRQSGERPDDAAHQPGLSSCGLSQKADHLGEQSQRQHRQRQRLKEIHPTILPRNNWATMRKAFQEL
jgi:hypothetical protein